MVEIFLSYRWPFNYFASIIGYSIGTRADHDKSNRVNKAIGEGVSIDFIDNDFKNPNYEIILEKAKKYNAKYAVCPDIYNEKDLDQVLDLANKLDRNGTTPIVVPKTKFNDAGIKDGWVLGFSVNSDYGGTNVSYSFFEGHDVHLLGGSIKKQEKDFEMLINKKANIVSIDSNYFFKSAAFDSIVNCPEDIFNGGNYNENGVDWLNSWESRSCVSLARYYEFWQKKENRYQKDKRSLFDY